MTRTRMPTRKPAKSCFDKREPKHSHGWMMTANYGRAVSFDPNEMVQRFKERAAAVRKRPLPPVAGEERQQFIAQANSDFQDFAMIGDAQASLDDGILTLRIDLRPADKRS